MIDILETLKKHLSESERNKVKLTGNKYFECSLKTDSKNRGHRCLECLPCSYFNFLTLYLQKNNDALIQSTKLTFENIKKRLQHTNKYIDGEVLKGKDNPLFKADIILAIPNISVKPTLDDMQSLLNKVIQNILKMSQDLPEWRHSIKLRENQIREIEKQAIEEGEDPKAAVIAKMPKNLSKIIAEHKDIYKLVISFNSCMTSFKDDVSYLLRNFTNYSELWEQEPTQTVEDYMKINPLIVDLEAKFRHYKVIFK